MEVRVLGVRKLRKMVERRNPLSTMTQVTSQCTPTNNLLKAGLLKSGKLINRWMIERGNPLSPLGQGRTHEFRSSFSHQKTKHVVLEEEETHDRTGQPVVRPQRGAMPQQFIIGDDEAELELSLGSRSFLDRVNDQVRERQKRSSMNVTENDEQRSVIWGMFMSVTLESALFMVKNCLDNQHSIKNTIAAKIITVLTRYRPIVLELI